MKKTQEFAAVAEAMPKIDFCMMQTVGEHGINTWPMSIRARHVHEGLRVVEGWPGAVDLR